MLEWLATFIERHGETMEVPVLNADQHERIDALSELAERLPPDKITVVKA